MTKRLRRALGGTLLIILALLIGFASVVWYKLDSTLPPTDGTIELSGIDGPIEITIDSMGIAQIWAETEHDAIFGLGWMHAADRMFQTDFTRRVSQGRLSELLGAVTVGFDKERRRDGHTRMAQGAFATLSEENHSRLQAYTDGINAYKHQGGSPPLEYIVLQKEFEDWRLFDCLTGLSFMTWYSDALQNRDGFFATLVRDGNRNALLALPVGYPSWGPSTVRAKRAGANGGGFRERFALSLASMVLGSGPQSFSPARSSNAWAVAPSRSESGGALFCSDPHLEISRLPQFWYYVGIHVKEPRLDAAGITIPGLPFVVMGHNGQAAWAFTAGGVDLVDYYVERVNPVDSREYMKQIDPSRGADSLVWAMIESVQDTIRIAFADTVAMVTTKITRHGPVVSEWSDNGRLYAWRWAGQDANLDQAVSAGFDLMWSADFESFRRTVTSMGALNANWMYADRGGNIGYQLGSPVPLRGDVSPYLPADGWIPENDWDGYAALADVPWALNPEEGWLANCNNQADDAANIPGAFAPDRILRITELLESKERFTVADMHRFQMDRTDAYRMRWKRLVDSIASGITDTAGVLQAVAEWNGDTDTSSRAIGVLSVFTEELKREIFADELPDHFGEIGRFTLDQVMFGDGADWIDDISTTERVETRMEIAARALVQSLEIVGSRKWGQMQSLRMTHPMANVPVVARFIDMEFGPWPWGGTPGTLNSAFSNRVSPSEFEVVVSPSLRFVVDFNDADGATMVLPAGNSGNPLSEHFFDFFDMWRSGGRWNVPISRERVFARAQSVLTLAPADSVEVGQ